MERWRVLKEAYFNDGGSPQRNTTKTVDASVHLITDRAVDAAEKQLQEKNFVFCT